MTEHAGKTRFELGLEKLAEVDGTAGAEVVGPLGDLGRYIVEFGFGDIYSRDGLTPAEIEEVIIHTVTFAGFPTAINAMNLLHSVVEGREEQTTADTPTDAATPDVRATESVARQRT